jgi:hypothetical protein
MRRLMNGTAHRTIYPRDQLEKNEKGGECSTDGDSRDVFRVLVRKLTDTTWKTNA